MDRALRNTIIAGILLIGVSVAFYFLYYLPNKERKLETARQECANRITEQENEAKELYASENCDQPSNSGTSGWKTEIRLGSDEYKKLVRCRNYKDKMSSAYKPYDDDFKNCLREKGLAN